MRIRTRQFAPLVILLISFLLSPLTLAAQTGTRDWSQLSSVAAGSKLSVKLRNGKKVDGTLSSVSDTSLTLSVKNVATEVKRDDVLTVHQFAGKSAGKSTLIGLGVGAGVGAVLGIAADASNNDDGFEKIDNVAAAGIAVVGAAAGAITGFVIGKTRKKKVLVYEAK